MQCASFLVMMIALSVGGERPSCPIGVRASMRSRSVGNIPLYPNLEYFSDPELASERGVTVLADDVDALNLVRGHERQPVASVAEAKCELDPERGEQARQLVFAAPGTRPVRVRQCRRHAKLVKPEEFQIRSQIAFDFAERQELEGTMRM